MKLAQKDAFDFNQWGMGHLLEGGAEKGADFRAKSKKGKWSGKKKKVGTKREYPGDAASWTSEVLGTDE